jgi:hypothetical protein
MPPEIASLIDWTELTELCDWDEERAAKLLEAVRLESKPLMPSGRRLELCRAILGRQRLIDQKQSATVPVAEA